jgi:hypothetical protein
LTVVAEGEVRVGKKEEGNIWKYDREGECVVWEQDCKHDKNSCIKK